MLAGLVQRFKWKLFDRVTRLELMGVGVSDENVPSLAGLRNLEVLTLTATRISDQRVTEFRRQHPECEVYVNGVVINGTATPGRG